MAAWGILLSSHSLHVPGGAMSVQYGSVQLMYDESRAGGTSSDASAMRQKLTPGAAWLPPLTHEQVPEF